MLCHPELWSAAVGWEKNGAGKDVDAHGDHTMSTHEPLSPAVLAPARHPQTVRSAALHHAVRRDLLRLERVLDEPMTAVRRQAVIGHVGFLLDQLTAEHQLLDRSIWPTAVLRRPDLSDLAERVRNAHQDLRPAVVVVRNATLGWSRSALTRLTVLSAVRELNDRLGPVIDQDANLLPLACEALPPAPAEIERRIRLENPTRLARRPFWLLDDLDARQAELLLQRTPPAAMWILRNGFSGGYNRSSYLMWVGGGTGPAV